MDLFAANIFMHRPWTVEPGEIVAGGPILWLHARSHQVISVRGDSLPPAAPTVSAGGGLVPGPGLEVWPVQLPPGVTIWRFDAIRGGWQAGLPGDLAPLGNIAREIAPGEVIDVHSAEAIELSLPRPELQVAYFHQDHLASASVGMDSAGKPEQPESEFTIRLGSPSRSPIEMLTLDAGSVRYAHPDQPEPTRETNREWALEPRTKQ